MAIGDKTLQFLPEDFEVIDMHTHIDTISGCNIRSAGAESVLKYMDKLNFKKSVISSIGSISHDFKLGNDNVDKAITKYPDKLLGYVTVNPNYEDGTIKEIERLRKNKNFIGIKIHPSHCGISVIAESLNEVYAYAHEMHSIVLVHTWSDGDIAGLTEISKKFPEMRLIMAHSGALGGVKRCAESIRNNKNLYCDFPIASAPFGMIEYLVKNGDASKILFGTDSTLADPRITYGRVLFADIDDSDKIKIFSENAKRILSESNI